MIKPEVTCEQIMTLSERGFSKSDEMKLAEKKCQTNSDKLPLKC